MIADLIGDLVLKQWNAKLVNQSNLMICEICLMLKSAVKRAGPEKAFHPEVVHLLHC
jgi:hypothetical protein